MRPPSLCLEVEMTVRVRKRRRVTRWVFCLFGFGALQFCLFIIVVFTKYVVWELSNFPSYDHQLESVLLRSVKFFNIYYYKFRYYGLNVIFLSSHHRITTASQPLNPNQTPRLLILNATHKLSPLSLCPEEAILRARRKVMR